MKENRRFLVTVMMSASLLAVAQERGTAVKLNGWVIDSAVPIPRVWISQLV